MEIKMKEVTADSRCEGCGCQASEDNDLFNWMRFKFEDKIMCENCTDSDIDVTYRKLGFSEAEIKALSINRRASRST
jgi:hypothetical protein